MTSLAADISDFQIFNFFLLEIASIEARKDLLKLIFKFF